VPGNAPAADRKQKGEANHNDWTVSGQLSRIARVIPFVPVLPAAID